MKNSVGLFWKFPIGNSRGDEHGKWPRVLEKCPESFVRFHGKLSTGKKNEKQIQNDKLFWSFLEVFGRKFARRRADEDGKWPRVLEKLPESFARFHRKLSTKHNFSKDICRKTYFSEK